MPVRARRPRRYLSNLAGGRVLYLGQTVLDEVRARGLPETRESERQVRIDLRNKNGPAAFAKRTSAGSPSASETIFQFSLTLFLFKRSLPFSLLVFPAVLPAC